MAMPAISNLTANQTEEVAWESLIPSEQLRLYACVLKQLCNADIPFALGGGLALGYYTGNLRRSKDLDIYVAPEDKDRVVAVMNRCGLDDYFELEEYDRGWIYRGHRDGVIIDVIWAMANRRTCVDKVWTSTGPIVHLCGQTFRVIPPEELLWSKLYVMQRDRCDWPDLLNLLAAIGPSMNWPHLASRAAEDKALLKALLSVFAWVAPDRAMEIPRRVWRSFDLVQPIPVADPAGRPSRRDLLDTRPWFSVPQKGASRAA
jgi:Uncharacterised nucleotidyltransferase